MGPFRFLLRMITLLAPLVLILAIRGRKLAASRRGRVPDLDEDPLGWTDPARIEAEMVRWLSSAEGLGTKPDLVRLRHTYRIALLGSSDVNFHLVEYCMPDGTYGRGCVGLRTGAFGTAEQDAVPDDDLIRAYVGSQWIDETAEEGDIVTDFTSDGHEAALLRRKDSEGLTDVRVTGRYRVGDTEIFEYQGTGHGVQVHGAAADAEDDTCIPEDDPRFALPAIYFHFARHLIDSIR